MIVVTGPGRTLGKVERFIWKAARDEPGVLIPVLEIAGKAGYDVTRPATRQSFRRAACSLPSSVGVQNVGGVPNLLCVYFRNGTPPAFDTETKERIARTRAAVRSKRPQTDEELRDFAFFVM